MSPHVDLTFPLLGQTVPLNQGHAQYAALSRLVPALHERDWPVAIGPLQGDYTGADLLRLDERRAGLRLRIPADQIAPLLPLAGKAIDIAGHKLRLGVPRVQALIPAASLIARMVTIKKFTEPTPFLEACRRQLDDLGVAGEVAIPLVEHGPHQGKPRRRILKIKDKTIVGFAVQIEGLSAEESLIVQERGIGGRRKMGCGFFVPLLPRSK